MRNKNRRTGVAMIMVLVMIVIFAALILTVVISSSAAIRRAHYYKDKAVALQIAQAGLQEALYKMNYENYGWGPGHLYPFGDGSPTININLPGFSAADYATVSVDTSDCDTKLVSLGRYRGRTAQISVNLKGYAKLGDSLHSETGGIPEAFNKHTIYATDTVTFPAAPTGINIRGNVTAPSITNKPTSLSQATWVETTIDLSDMVLFETAVCAFSLPYAPTFDNTFNETGLLFNATYPSGVDVNTLSDGVRFAAGVYYLGRKDDNTAQETFLYSNETNLFRANVVIPSNAGNVTIGRYFKVDLGKNITIDKDITTTTSNNDFAFETTGLFSLTSGRTITGNLVVRGTQLTLNNNIQGKVMCDNNITISGGTINGDVLSNGNITIISGGTIKGSVVCYDTSPKIHVIDISGSPTIDATSSNFDAAVYIHNSSSTQSETVIINGSPTIKLGENQRAGIVVVAGTGNITISNPFNLNYPSTTPDQFAIVNYSGSGNVNITANNLTLRGSIYSYPGITLDNNTQKITGILVSGGPVNIGDKTTIVYDPEPYKNNSRVYKGFYWGRRRYVPVPGSWRIIW